MLVGHSYGGAVITNAAAGNHHVKALRATSTPRRPLSGRRTAPSVARRRCSSNRPRASSSTRCRIPERPSGAADLYLKRKIPSRTYANDSPAGGRDPPLGTPSEPRSTEAFDDARSRHGRLDEHDPVVVTSSAVATRCDHAARLGAWPWHHRAHIARHGASPGAHIVTPDLPPLNAVTDRHPVGHRPVHALSPAASAAAPSSPRRRAARRLVVVAVADQHDVGVAHDQVHLGGLVAVRRRGRGRGRRGRTSTGRDRAGRRLLEEGARRALRASGRNRIVRSGHSSAGRSRRRSTPARGRPSAPLGVRHPDPAGRDRPRRRRPARPRAGMVRRGGDRRGRRAGRRRRSRRRCRGVDDAWLVSGAVVRVGAASAHGGRMARATSRASRERAACRSASPSAATGCWVRSPARQEFQCQCR